MSHDGTRKTYKAELIVSIQNLFRRTAIPVIPVQCLRDMSTASLAAFRLWVEPIVRDNPIVEVMRHLPPAK